MSDAQPVDSEDDVDATQRPRFRGCVFCQSSEWAVYAGRKAIPTALGVDCRLSGSETRVKTVCRRKLPLDRTETGEITL